MTDTQPLRLYSKTSVEKDWRCPRQYYLNYYWNGTGLVSSETGVELFLGVAVHDSLAAIALSHPNVDIDLIATTAYNQMYEALAEAGSTDPDGEDYAKEQSTLVEGMVRGFYRQVWPSLISRYPTIKLVEQPIIYKHNGIGMMARPDLVLADKDGRNWYIEYKTTSNKKAEWINSWQKAIQVHAGIVAVADFMKEEVAGVIVQGLYKGTDYYGKQSSPFCYLYKSRGSAPFYKETVQYEYKAGFKRQPIWENPGGIKKWIEGMPSNIIGDQFPQTPPIFLNQELVDRFLEQRAQREHGIINSFKMIEEVPEMELEVMDRVFPQRFDMCTPAWGWDCPYVKICHGPHGNPLDEGYVPRDDSHQAIFKELLT